ncbi:Outer membrane protein assembly factor BamB [bacterium HR15]|nr:Outer membrane protein assembly factor BamB [bacterium HR15]
MKTVRLLGVLVALAGTLAVWFAQIDQDNSWATHRGNNVRTGVTTNSRNSAVKMLLGWTYPFLPLPGETRQPQLHAPVIVDNDDSGGRVSFTGSWIVPPTSDAVGNAWQEDPNTTQPYRYALGVRGRPNATFTWRSGPLPAGIYKVFVYLPSSGTQVGGEPRLNLQRAHYRVTDSNGTQDLFLDQTAGGWEPLGERSFIVRNDGGEITIQLDNSIDPEGPDATVQPTPIVVADAVRFVPDYGMIQASPVVIRNPLDPNRHLVFVANGNGTITCLEHVHNDNALDVQVRWQYHVLTDPNQAGAVIMDDTDADFVANGWERRTDLPDQYGTSYYRTAPTDDPLSALRAVWRVQVSQSGRYYVYAWFPSSNAHARKARYLVEDDIETATIEVNQVTGGRWVLLRSTPFTFTQGSTYEISVSNFSPEDANVRSRYVIADAIKLVPAELRSEEVFSTPAIGQVRVRDGNSLVSRWVLVFGAQDGYVYCLDALGDPTTGQTRLYWRVKPDTAGPFSYASPLILENKNLVIIGNPSGSVYAINTDLDAGNRDTWLKWEYRLRSASFVGAPAYDASRDTVFIGSVEGGGFFGRLYALDPTTTDNNRRLKWAYPPLDQDPIEPITATPAVARGKVYINTGGIDGGLTYAINASNGQLVWKQPAQRTTILSFSYSSPLVVEGLDFDNDPNTPPVSAVFVGTTLGRMIAYNADTGDPLRGPDNQNFSERLSGSIFSSPVFTQVNDTDPQGTDFGAKPAIVVGTNAGELVALHATNARNARGGWLFEGWKLYTDTLFASPAVLDDWLYIADDAGVVYAFNLRGLNASQLPGELGDEMWQTGPETRPDQGDFSHTKVTVTLNKQDADDVLTGRKKPDEVVGDWPKALEWGQTFYVIVWDFKLSGTETRRDQLAVQVVGPGVSRVQYVLAPRKTDSPPASGRDYIAVQSITIQASGSNFWTPGPEYELQLRVPGMSFTSDLNLETMEIDRPDRSNPGGEGWKFGVANPLWLQGIGVVGSGDTDANVVNGNGGVSVLVDFESNGVTGHGKTISGRFSVADRRPLSDPSLTPLPFSIRAWTEDLRWQGGVNAVIAPLPWEVPPTLPNRSPDYPDIASRRMQVLYQGGTDLRQSAARPSRTPGDPVVVQVDVPRYQPANNIGYRSRTFIYVDSNNNGRFDGLDKALSPGANMVRMEAFREVNAAVRVEADARFLIEDETIDFGSLPGGFGFNFGALFAGATTSQFRPDNPIFTPYWKPFRVRNEGNINLYPLYLGKAFGSPSNTIYLFSDMVSTFAGMPAWTTVVSTLDPRFWSRNDPLGLSNNPYWQPNVAWPQWGMFVPGYQPYAVLQKARPGDFTGTRLSLPAVPYGRSADVDGDGQDDFVPRLPQVSIAIPPFQPMGVYSQWIGLHRGSVAAPGVVGNDDPITIPSMRIVVRVRETQLTGGVNRGSQVQIDPPPATNTTRISNLTPTAFRDPQTGRLHLYWSSNRDPNNPTSFYLYKATLNWNGNTMLLDNVPLAGGWTPATLSGQWWQGPVGPFPNDLNGDLFVQALGLGRTLTTEERRTIRHHQPVAYLTTDTRGSVRAWLFWTGEVQIRGINYALLFYTQLNPQTGDPVGQINAVPVDPALPRSRPHITGLPGIGNWLFYIAAPSGRNQIFYLPSEGDSFANWRREQSLPLSSLIRSVDSVAAQVYRVTLDPTRPSPFVLLADVVITGTVGERTEPEVLLARYYVDPRNGTLQPLDSRQAERLLGVIQDRLLPRLIDEVASKDEGRNVWRVRHLDWTRIGRVWNEDPLNADLDIKVNGQSVLVDLANPSQLQEPVEDEATGLLTFRYIRREANNTLVDAGAIVVDPLNGTIRFTGLAPRLNDVVTVTYRPRLLRLNPYAPGKVGGYSQVFTVLQRTLNPRHNLNDPTRSFVRKGTQNGVCSTNDHPPVDRQWVLFRRGGSTPNSTGNFYYKTLRPGIRLAAPIFISRGGLPLQQNTSALAMGTNHAVVLLTPNNPANSGLGFYEYDPLRGNIYFTTEDLGKEVEVRYLTWNSTTRQVEERREVQVIRWVDEGNLSGNLTEYLSPVPIDLPTNEMYLWAISNLEYRAAPSPLNAFGGFDEALLLFWSSTRNGVPDIYAGAIQPRFYISPFDPDAD